MKKRIMLVPQELEEEFKLDYPYEEYEILDTSCKKLNKMSNEEFHKLLKEKHFI